ncbi:uL15 family ribosomal protein [Candidatus Woesearchaeota archaeon]|nr:50S ribosomal protein L15P [uncultured archaeon]MBS3122717.1 uL15 family ribosomal protein [Candidatus Woesearchaeota archaeon]
MPARRRRKTSRQRGTHTHGWGAKKKHRGSGHRGGYGMAGTGKRADAKKPSIWNTDYFGSYGFVRPRSCVISGINISSFEENYSTLLSEGLIKEEQGFSVIDLSSLKMNKLLSCGTPTKKYKITADYASKNAIEKIKAKGGEVILKKEVKIKKDKKKDNSQEKVSSKENLPKKDEKNPQPNKQEKGKQVK